MQVPENLQLFVHRGLHLDAADQTHRLCWTVPLQQPRAHWDKLYRRVQLWMLHAFCTTQELRSGALSERNRVYPSLL